MTKRRSITLQRMLVHLLPPAGLGVGVYRSTSLIRNSPTPLDPPRTLGIGLLYGPTGGGCL